METLQKFCTTKSVCCKKTADHKRKTAIEFEFTETLWGKRVECRKGSAEKVLITVTLVLSKTDTKTSDFLKSETRVK